MVAEYIPAKLMMQIESFMLPENAFALRLMRKHGMRISDCLNLKARDFTYCQMGLQECVTYTEQKTGKQRSFKPDLDDYISVSKINRGHSEYVFPGQGRTGHRTRQAVWKDLHRVAQLYRVDGHKLCRNLGTHTARKIYAVKLFEESIRNGEGDPMDIVRVNLNHSDKAVTFLYAMADEIAAKRHAGKM